MSAKNRKRAIIFASIPLDKILEMFELVYANKKVVSFPVCNYTAVGDEVVENAVPIQTFRTSGNNASR